jgi:hypothetical protein
MIKNITINSTSYKDFGFDLHFPYMAYNAVLFEDKIIVGFDYGDLKKNDPNSEFWRALWCFDKTGNILWKVEPPYFVDQNTDQKKYPNFQKCEDAIQTAIYWENESMIVAFGRMGYRLDPETGKLGEIVYRER